MDVFLAGGIFVVAYALIASERFDRTLVALLGGLLVVALGVIDQEEAFAAIDFNVIFLLAGMMIIASGLSQTGFFEYVAGRAIHISRGEPFRLLIILARADGGARCRAGQRHDRRPARAGHPVTCQDTSRLPDAVPPQPDLRIEHRRDGDADR